MEDFQNENTPPIVPVKGKRGRKPKIKNIDEITENTEKKDENATGKKRGRKPRGGKIVATPVVDSQIPDVKPNVILHLKCPISSLSENANNTFEPYPIQGGNTWLDISNYDDGATHNNNNISNNNNNICETNQKHYHTSSNNTLHKKLTDLQHMLHLNNTYNEKSACFWCTCNFDTPPLYIIKYFLKGAYHAYGNFCSGECGVAYLMKENIDTSEKFERYQLMNYVYKPILDYTKNIKPAPSPHYTLKKFFGNLSEAEYRESFQQNRMFLLVEKPLTRIIPELHEDNGDFIVNQKMTQTSIYKIGQNQKNNK